MSSIEILLWCIYALSVILSADLIYWKYSQQYLHWKREQGIPIDRLKPSMEKANKKRYWKSKEVDYPVLIEVALIPILNIIGYILLLNDCFTLNYKFSNKYIIQDICSWKRGINSLIFKWWRPSEKWKKKYPIE